MKPARSLLPWVLLAIGLPLMCIIFTLFLSWSYTTGVLRLARSQGVYTSAEEGMRTITDRAYRHPYDLQIIYAGTNSFDGSVPNVWYVLACVWADHRADGATVGTPRHGYDQNGLFFLAARDGWVQVGEGYFPEVLGFWMRFYGLAGPGSSKPSHDWGSTATRGCDF